MKKTFLLFILVLIVSELSHVKVSHKYNIEQPTQETAIVTSTMYFAVQGQCDADPLITAGMYRINPKRATEQKFIALSRDLLKRWKGKFDYGDKVKIEGAGKKDGIYIVADCMNARFHNKIDILETRGVKMYKFTNVKITKCCNISLS